MDLMPPMFNFISSSHPPCAVLCDLVAALEYVRWSVPLTSGGYEVTHGTPRPKAGANGYLGLQGV